MTFKDNDNFILMCLFGIWADVSKVEVFNLLYMKVSIFFAATFLLDLLILLINKFEK
jgi:hypothetical protein